MKRLIWFIHLVKKSLAGRKIRVGLAIGALSVSSALCFSLGGISLGIGSKLGEELRAYGANMLLVPEKAQMGVGAGGLNFGEISLKNFLKEHELKALGRELKEVDGKYAFNLFATAKMSGNDISILGVDFKELKHFSSGWRIKGRLSESAEESLVGVNVFKSFGLKTDRKLLLKRGNKSLIVKIVGVIETGGAEDDNIYVSLPSVQRFIGVPDAVSSVLISARTDQIPIETTAERIRRSIPNVEVKTIRQVAHAEAELLNKVKMLLALVTIGVMVACGLSVMSTMSSTVLERRKEIGLMSALGGSRMAIGSLFLAEAILMGLGGGILGYLIGFTLIQLIAQSVFGSTISISSVLLPIPLVVGMGIAIFASLGPVKSALSVDPAISLRGE